jgi:putative hydrolase of HD superfamily
VAGKVSVVIAADIGSARAGATVRAHEFVAAREGWHCVREPRRGCRMRGMNDHEIEGTLAFLSMAERLKDTLRTGHTAQGRSESTAEHTWRLCLMALVLGESLGEVDAGRLLRICLVHDLAEALTGDLPAPLKRDAAAKAAEERAALATLTATLPAAPREAILALWEEYEAGTTREARLAKGLDKLETILQHTQGRNPPGFNLAYNLEYGRAETDADPLLALLRAKLDARTREKLAEDAVSLPGSA